MELVTKDNIKDGMSVEKKEENFLVVKVNSTFFYCISHKEIEDPKSFLDKFYSKPKSQKITEFCKLTGMIKASYKSEYLLTDLPRIAHDKTLKKKTTQNATKNTN